jgi:hypothetical protein
MQKPKDAYRNSINRNLVRYRFYIISLAYVLWSLIFIANSSFIGIDGRRYFCLFDDAMISMRYAWNFSHGIGLVWNEGERVQGYSNLLMTLFMSIPTFVFDKSTSVFFVQASGIAVMLLIGFISNKIIYLFSPDKDRQRLKVIGLLSFVGALSYYPLIFWTLMGMETGLLALLLLCSIYFSLKFVDDQRPIRLILASLFMGLAFLSRNDSLIYAILIGFYVFWSDIHRKLIRRNAYIYLAAIVIYAFFVSGQIWFQYLYYGSLLPNTYILKLTGMPFLPRIINGIGFIELFLKNTINTLLYFLLVDLLFGFRKKKALFLAIFLSSILYQVYIGGDPWHYWRMMAPTFPLLIMLAINAFDEFVYSISSAPSFRSYIHRRSIFPVKYTLAGLVSVMSGLLLVSLNSPYITRIAMLHKPFDVENNQIQVNKALALNELLMDDASIGVFRAGALPYYVDVKAVDFLGKSDRYIAQLPPDMSGNVSWSGMISVPGHNNYDLTYSIKKRKPTYIEGYQWGNQDLSGWIYEKYVNVEYKGIMLMLLKDSRSVQWDKLSIH